MFLFPSLFLVWLTHNFFVISIDRRENIYSTEQMKRSFLFYFLHYFIIDDEDYCEQVYSFITN